MEAHPRHHQGPRFDEDLELARSILAGSIPAWHAFVEEYAGLLHHVLRRYLFDEDEVRTVFVDVLEQLYRGRLSSYEGRSSLASWLALVGRSAAMDALRHRFGRFSRPVGLERLDARDREIFRLYYVEGVGFQELLVRMERADAPLDSEELAAALGRIERSVSRRSLRRIAYDLHAQSVGQASGRLLEYVDHLREQMREDASAQSPELQILLHEAQRTVESVRRALGQLPDDDRRILELRFHEGRSARAISDEMELGGQRRAYTLIDRALRRLRQILAPLADAG